MSPVQFTLSSRSHRISHEPSFTDDPWDQLSPFGVEFWQAHLYGAPEVLELPTDRPRPAVLSYAGGNVGLKLTPELSAGMRRLSQRHCTTLFTILLTGWAALLARLSGQYDIVIGAPVINRRIGSDEAIAGPIVNTVALRVRLDGDPTIAELIAQISATTASAYGHRGVPIAQVIEALQPARCLSHNPIFQVMLALGSPPPEGEMRIHIGDPEDARSAAQLDLTLSLCDLGECVEGVLNYASELFDRSRIERMAEHLLTLLADMAIDDRRHISELNLLTQSERQQVLLDWNATEAAFPSATLAELFAAQVARTPTACAVADGARALSYMELDRAADAVAAALQARGVGPESVVGVALSRSLETVVAALGILKAGGVYLPLDPAIPDLRLRFIVGDACAVLVITEESVAPRLPPEVAQWRLAQSAAGAAPHPVALTPEHLAYVIYTSGSSGTPKGVAVSHASLVNLAFARTRGHDPIGPGDRVLAAISVGFDVSIGQLLLPLLAGACVVVAPDLRSLSAEAFWAFLADQRVSHINSVPSFLDSVINAAAQQPNLVLKRLMLGGEPLTGALCRRLRAALPATVVINMYGPTEACIDATAYVVPEDVDYGLPMLPIGRPLANYRAYVLDARLQLLPPGMAGELYLGGPGLARGYLGAPELTAQRFIADPFGPAGGRLYRTGDRALWSADGMLQFLGRLDEQVKIRGFRVEPGEIEAVLCTHPSVAQAAVVARSEHDTIQLVAYVVPIGAQAVKAELRAYVARTLPAHMMPLAFVSLDALPLTPNGKLERKALPLPDGLSAPMSRYEAPADLTETRIAGIFQELLGANRVGRHDDFFELGGHSLLVLRLVATIKAEFGRPIAMARVFRSPTPAQLAAALNEARVRPNWKHLVALNEGGTASPLFCLNGYDGDVDSYLHIARFIDPPVPVYGLEVADKHDALHETLEWRIESYVREVRSVQPRGPYRLCGFSFGGAEAFDLACRLEQAGEQVVLILLDAYRPSKWLEVSSAAARLIRRAQTGQLLRSARRRIERLLDVLVASRQPAVHLERECLAGSRRHAMQRRHAPFSGRVVLFKSTGMEEWAYQLRLDGRNGWKKFIKGPFDVIHIDAVHSALIKEPTVLSVVGHINRILSDPVGA